MLLSVVQIGNSKGIRIPKAILEQCNIQDRIELEVAEGRITIEAVRDPPRKGWAAAFSNMTAHKDDTLLIADNIDLEMEDWAW